MDSSKLTTEFPNSLGSKKDTPSSVEEDVQSIVEILVRRKSTTIDPSHKKKGKKNFIFPLRWFGFPRNHSQELLQRYFPLRKHLNNQLMLYIPYQRMSIHMTRIRKSYNYMNS